MYRCESCHKEFEYPRKYYEFDTGYRAEECPYCGCTHLEEAERCKVCGEYIYGYDEFCSSCMEDYDRYVEQPVLALYGDEDVDITLGEYYDGKLDENKSAEIKKIMEKACIFIPCDMEMIEDMAAQKYDW